MTVIGLKILLRTFFYLCVLLLAVGCAGAKKELVTESSYSVSGSVAATGSTREGTTVQSGNISQNQTHNRKIYYNGFIESKATKPNAVVEKAIVLVESVDGYVENRSDSNLIVRVPVDQFHSVYEQFLKLADPVRKSITAEDITDQYFDRELRLKTSIIARDRLIALLALSTQEEEKIKLLAEIQRLNMQIEKLENEVHILDKLAKYSKIIFRVTPRQPFKGKALRREDESFQWINRLSPFKNSAVIGQKPISLPVPQSMVRLEHDSIWLVESAEGVTIRAYERLNNPIGTTEFWVNAVSNRIGSDFISESRLTAGDFTILRFVSRSETPYVYWVAVNASSTGMKVVEAFFPKLDDETRYAQGVKTALKGDGQ